ncbi:MAG: replicative DNA helicase [Alphaproteobacteria bacterium]|nr:replicative DNA helicase [Alphaproteobacteria bacterium]MCB9696526.1 replicative DNA helicase [Alphaproteobacteria bacterium]
MNVERPYPQAVEAERALLGGLMTAPDNLDRVGDVVRPDDFYRPEHGQLFKLLVEMRSRAESIDLVTVSERILRGGQPDRFGGAGYVAELPEHAPSTANLVHYAEIVREKAALRELIRVSVDVANRAWDQPEDVSTLLDQAAKEVALLGQGGSARTWNQVSEIVDRELVRIEKLAEHGGTTTGKTTGFADLDKKLAGLHGTDLLILAARPAMGKTALALNVAQNVALMENVPVGIFSLEMSRGQLVTRMLCCHGLVDAGRVRTGTLGTDDWERFLDASEYLRKARIHIDDTPNLSIIDVRARARRLKTEQPELALIVIDYLQLMRGDDPRAPREQQISAISRGLKGLAKDLDCAVIALSQLNRGVESRQDKRPLVSDLRESGAIEQDADVILFIYRDDYYNPESLDKGLAEVIIAKQRNGPTGTVKLAFQGQFTRFDNYLDDDVLL